MFKLKTKFSPMGDQENAIKTISEFVNKGEEEVVLVGATGTGKTFTVANVIKNVNKPTLIMVHNKTLAGQLYEEFKQLFPDNRVEYFISNFDFYQPEAYIANSDTYIDKNSKHNVEIDMLRLSALNALSFDRDNTIVIATVAAIYGSRSPIEYKEMFFELSVGQTIERKKIISKLVSRGYKRNDVSLEPGTFKVRGDVIEIAPGWTNEMYIMVDMFGDEIEMIAFVNTMTGEIIEKYKSTTIFPADDYSAKQEQVNKAIEKIKVELKERLEYFEKENRLVEYQRLEQRTANDLASLKEFGTCSGIENYSMHLDGREFGSIPYTLLDYLGDDWLLIIDESHITLPQIGGMFNGDQSRKESLVDYGFRLPSAKENRPLNIDEFRSKVNQIVYVTATPGKYELEHVDRKYFVEQIIRPTGIVDAQIEVSPSVGQIDKIIEEVKLRIKANERTFITTLTKKMAEDLTDYLIEKGLKVAYLHSDLKTFERLEVLRQLRIGRYDVVVGINLLREGLDIPEVSLVCILDANKQGFLRNTNSLIQSIGRACRNTNGKVIMFADSISDSMKEAIDETNRRRSIQEEYNRVNNITPITIKKDILGPLRGTQVIENVEEVFKNRKKVTDEERVAMIKDFRKQMMEAAKNMDYENAALFRDAIIELEK